MQLDPGAVTQIARTYHGYYLVKGATSSSHVLRYDNDCQEEGGSSLEINCREGIIVIRLRTPHRGKSEVERHNADYNTLHQVFKDPRCFFLPAIVKPKRRSSRELSSENKSGDDEPVVFQISAYKDPGKPKPVVLRLPLNGIIGSGLVPGGMQDLGAPLCGVLGPRVPADINSIGPKVPQCGPVVLKVSPVQKKEADTLKVVSEPPQPQKKEADTLEVVSEPTQPVSEVSVPVFKRSMLDPAPKSGGEKVYGPAKPDPELLPREAVDQDLQTVDQLYRTKTRTEMNYLKRKQELDRDRLKKKAVLSHKDKIEGFNSYLGNLPEFNEQRKINWSKH